MTCCFAWISGSRNCLGCCVFCHSVEKTWTDMLIAWRAGCRFLVSTPEQCIGVTRTTGFLGLVKLNRRKAFLCGLQNGMRETFCSWMMVKVDSEMTLRDLWEFSCFLLRILVGIFQSYVAGSYDEGYTRHARFVSWSWGNRSGSRNELFLFETVGSLLGWVV